MRQIALPVALQILAVIASHTFSEVTYGQGLSVRVSAGVVQLPLSDWSDFFGKQDSSFYQKNNPNVYFGLSLYYAFSECHSVSIGTELIRSSASLSSSFIVVDWKFQGIPVTIGYEYRLPTFNEHFMPSLGLGISYFISQVEANEHLSFSQSLKRTGNGYGVHGSVGLISQLTKSLSMFSQLRYRYSNGMAFTDKKNDIKVEFTGLDFSAGLAWAL